MRITFLGTGESSGIPRIGCYCNVCRSNHPKNKRTRTSALFTINGKNILIDTSPEFRQQALDNNIKNIDAVLYTHSHADHCHGIDDLRRFNRIQNKAIDIYGDNNTIKELKSRFSYVFTKNKEYIRNTSSKINYSYNPQLIAHTIKDPEMIKGIKVEKIPIKHGINNISGYKIGRVAYLTDCSCIPKKSKDELKNLDLLIIQGLRQKPFPTVFSIPEALEAARELKAKKCIITHIGHEVDHFEISKSLPKFAKLAYDGMVLDL